jgi:glycerol-3-phosphate acyltransferase PlsX
VTAVPTDKPQGGTVTIAVDVLGGDRAPEVVLDGIAKALEQRPGLRFVCTGPKDVVTALSDSHPGSVIAHPTTQSIAMDEHPATAIREKKDSSIVKACQLVAKGEADAFFSAGSTGACMAAATLAIGRVKGVARPAIATVIPAASPVVLLDIGANADVKLDYMLQFAQMGGVYAKLVLGVESPRIGLLNIGTERQKGSAFLQEAHALLEERLGGFAGNAEGGDLFSGRFDCIVTDGATGNIVLKTVEGTASALMGMIKVAMTSTLGAKVGAALAKGQLRQVKNDMSAEKYGAAPLLGLRNVVSIAHGSSNADAIASGLLATEQAVFSGLPARIAEATGADES